MHELSIAEGIVDIVAEASEKQGDARVTAVHLRLGALAGVVEEALLFSFEVAAAGTAAEKAELRIERVPVTVYCPLCQMERILPGPQPVSCPECGTPTPRVIAGTELEVVALEVESE
jgi:hydrogenase nickel incorporation protein HypA/HybF